MEQFTTKCNVISNGVTILGDRNVSITIRLDPKSQMIIWDGMLYLTGNDSIIFFTSMGQTFEIELMDGRRGEFHAVKPWKTVVIKGSGPLQ